MAGKGSGRLRFATTAVLVLVAFAILIGLGTWQLQRLAWKENLLSEIEARRHAAPLSIAEIEAVAARGEDVDYRPVTVTGTFVNNRERHFFATDHGRTGYYIYTPLSLADGRFLFVNRGFVPFENKEPETRVLGQLTGEVTVSGLARAKLAGKPGALVPDNDPAKNIFYWKDLELMASSDGIDPAAVLPFFVDAARSDIPGGMPAGGVTIFDFPNNHLQYAMTWYGLALALAIVVGVALWRRLPRGRYRLQAR